MAMSDFLLSAHPNRWLLIEEGVDPAREREIESILAIANGYLGTRASIAEVSHPSSFVAGIYVPNAELELGPRLAVLSELVARGSRGGGSAVLA
jgi:kojibiose phosphorylase